MKKICIFILMISTAVFLTTACTKQKTKSSMVQAKRRFEKYVEPQNTPVHGNVIDLSEGPKLHYDANLGPRNLNFDFKIVDPY